MARKLITLSNLSTSANGVLLNPVARIFQSIGALVAALLDRQPEPQILGVVQQTDGSFKLYDVDATGAGTIKTYVTSRQITSTLPAGNTKKYVFVDPGGTLFGGAEKSLQQCIDLITDGEEDLSNSGVLPHDAPHEFLIDQNDGIIYYSEAGDVVAANGTEFAQVSPQGDKWE